MPRPPAPSAVRLHPSSFILHPSAFTLLELLTVLGIVAILTAIAVPAYQRVTAASRAAACTSNLRQIGAALNLYLAEHNQTMPPLRAGRSDRSEDVPVLDNTLNAYLSNPKVFACPADQPVALKSGTSYFWNVALSGQSLTVLNFLRHTDQSSIPILSDKNPVHFYAATRVNILYADGHADKELRFLSTPTPSPAP